MESGDAKPTNGAYKVYEELSAALDVQLAKLNTVLENYKAKVNPILNKNGLTPIE